MAINSTEVRGLYTKYVTEKLAIEPQATSFLKGFFDTKLTSALEISIEVERQGEPIAVDVLRGTSGNMNDWARSTEKIIIPPFFDERFPVNQLKGYDRAMGRSGEVTTDQFAMLLDETSTKIARLKNKINRRYELMCAQVFTTGIVTLTNGDNIDFLRQGSSKGVLGAGNWWTEAAIDPDTTLEAGAKFIRTQGLYGGSEFNVIMGAKAWNAYKNNPIIQKKNSILPWKLSDISTPVASGVGSDFLGRVSAGNYIFNVWGYSRFYNPAGTDKTGKVPYIPEEQVVILPNEKSFSFVYGGVPHVQRNTGSIAIPEYIEYGAGEFFVDNYVDARATTHEFAVKSAGVPIPTQVDAIYNSQVTA